MPWRFAARGRRQRITNAVRYKNAYDFVDLLVDGALDLMFLDRLDEAITSTPTKRLDLHGDP